MPIEIAVLIDRKGKITSLTEQGKVLVFTRKMGEWQVAREKKFTLSDVEGMADLRNKMRELLDLLAGCKIFVGAKLNGIPVNILEQANCKIWECLGSPEEFLDEIQTREECKHCQASDQDTMGLISDQQDGNGNAVCFVENTPGNFTVSVKEIQENNAQITTKQALLPFIKQNKFTTLEIMCNHIPQWLEMEVLRGGLAIKILEEEQTRVLLQKVSG